jgi:hypothetical protein
MRINLGSFPTSLMVAASLILLSGTVAAQDWQLVPSPSPSSFENVFRAVSGSSPSDIWAVGSYNTSSIPLRKYNFAAHYDGNQWTQYTVPNLGPTYNILMGVATLSPTDAWAVGAYNPPGPAQMTILRWDGNVWNDYGAPWIDGGASLNAIKALSADDIWAVGTKAGRCASMHWDGSNWNDIEVPRVGDRINRFWAVDGTSPDNVWAAGRHADEYGTFNPLIMKWDGSSWNHIPGPPGAIAVLNDIEVISPNDVWTSGVTVDGQPQFFHWDGNSVTVEQSPGGGRSLTSISADDIWSVDANTVVHWDGSQWGMVQSPSSAHSFAVELIPGGELWAVGTRYEGGIPWSMTMRYSLLTGVEDEGLALNPTEFRLHQNYPNPFNASTTISFSLTEPVAVSLRIHDLLGRTVATILDQSQQRAGDHQITWDAERFSSGVYFYRLQIGDKTETRRMVLLK